MPLLRYECPRCDCVLGSHEIESGKVATCPMCGGPVAAIELGSSTAPPGSDTDVMRRVPAEVLAMASQEMELAAEEHKVRSKASKPSGKRKKAKGKHKGEEAPPDPAQAEAALATAKTLVPMELRPAPSSEILALLQEELNQGLPPVPPTAPSSTPPEQSSAVEGPPPPPSPPPPAPVVYTTTTSSNIGAEKQLEQLRRIMEAVGPLMWGLDQAVSYVDSVGTSPDKDPHVRSMKLVRVVLTRLKGWTDAK